MWRIGRDGEMEVGKGVPRLSFLSEGGLCMSGLLSKEPRSAHTS